MRERRTDRSGWAQQEKSRCRATAPAGASATPRALPRCRCCFSSGSGVRVRRHVETPAVHLSLENSVRGYERQRLVRTQGLVPARVALVIIPKGTRYRVRRAKTVRMAHATATFAALANRVRVLNLRWKACAVGVHGHDKGVGLGDGTEDVLLVERFIVGLAAGLIVGVAVSASARCALREDRRDTTAGEVDVGLAHEHGLRSREGSGERRRRQGDGWLGARARDAAV